MPDSRKDRAVDGLARRQHGAFAHRQAVSIGFTRSEWRSRLGSGAWLRLLDSRVYALPSHPATWLRQCSAAVLSVPTSALSGPASAALYGFPDWPKAGLEVRCTNHWSHGSPFAKVRHSTELSRLKVVQGIRTISKADTVIDIAGCYRDAQELGHLVDTVGLTSPRLLDDLRDRHLALLGSRYPRAVMDQLEAVLDARADGFGPSGSELDRIHRAFLASLPLPPVRFEDTPWWVEPGKQRVDGWIEEWSLIVEADGRDWHTRVLDFERDRERDAVALAHGAETLRLTWNKLVHQPQWCATVLLAIGARRIIELRNRDR